MTRSKLILRLVLKLRAVTVTKILFVSHNIIYICLCSNKVRFQRCIVFYFPFVLIVKLN